MDTKELFAEAKIKENQFLVEIYLKEYTQNTMREIWRIKPVKSIYTND